MLREAISAGLICTISQYATNQSEGEGLARQIMASKEVKVEEGIKHPINHVKLPGKVYSLGKKQLQSPWVLEIKFYDVGDNGPDKGDPLLFKTKDGWYGKFICGGYHGEEDFYKSNGSWISADIEQEIFISSLMETAQKIIP